ncbi:hypothetical protein [Chitinophaga rupis]|uniref:hypothetical protein n=1 Tax=Chitinophaga rupis TaxID=573321 RepID=UPI00116014AD|nr:hypothetical protein [Chitinophaga rupis]
MKLRILVLEMKFCLGSLGIFIGNGGDPSFCRSKAGLRPTVWMAIKHCQVLESFCLAMVVILHFAGPKLDCARLFGWLLNIVKRMGFGGWVGHWWFVSRRAKVLALDLQKFSSAFIRKGISLEC